MARLILTMSLTGAAAAQAEMIVSKGTSGDLEYSYRQTRYDPGYAITSNLLTGRIANESYLWQPWLATVGFSLALTEERSSDSNGADNINHFTTGEAHINLLPMSRYPFTARYLVSDTRIDTNGADDNPLLAQSMARQFTRDQLQLTQGINGDRFRINLSYTNDEASSDRGEKFSHDAYSVDYGFRGSKQNLNANAQLHTQSNNQSSNDSDNTVFSVNHNYYPSNYTNIDTLASHVKSNNYYTTSFTGLTQQMTSTIDQASTSMNWRSSNSPLRIYGGLRVHQMDYLLDNGTATTSLQNEGFNSSLGANYQFTDRLMASVNGQYNILHNDSSEVRSHNEGATLNYTSAQRTIRSFDYSWNSYLSGSNQQSGESRAQSATLSLGHSASRSWSLEQRSSVRLSFSQNLQEGYTHSSGPALYSYSTVYSGEIRRLVQSASLGWVSNDQSGTSLAQITASDSRGIIGDDSSSQMVNTQLSRTQSLDNRSSLNGNLTWQAWHYTLPGLPDYGIGRITTAGLSYRYIRPFTLQRVTFVSDLRLSDIQPALGPSLQETYWDNRFTHEIGLLRSSLGLTLRDHMDVKSAMLTFSIKRIF